MKHSLIFLMITFIFFSCTKENSGEFIPDPANPYNDTAWVKSISAAAPVNQIFQNLSTPVQTNTINANTGGNATFDGELKVNFPSNACSTSVTGNVEVNVIHLKSKGDMIRYGKPTMSNDQLLVSGGAFHISLTQNGSPIKLANDKTITISYPALHYDPDMKVFYGDTSLNSREGFTWTQSNDGVSSVINYPLTDTTYLYHMISTKLEWVNCDRFFNGGDRTKVSVILPLNFTNNNTAVFFVLTNQFLVARAQADYTHRLFYLENMPIGNNFEVVTISKIGADLYLGTKDVTISSDMVIELSPQKKSQQEISDFLNSL